jgi:hypothetical protein
LFRNGLLVELWRVRSARAQRIARDLAGRVGRRPDPKRRLQRCGQGASGGVGRHLRQPSHQCARDGVTRRVEPCEIGTHVATLESLGARTEHGRRRRHRFLVLCAGELERNRPGVRREKREQPVKFVGNRRERSHGSGRAGRAVLGAQEAPAQTVDRLAGEA